MSHSKGDLPPDAFFQIYEVELGNADQQVYVDFCPSYVQGTSSKEPSYQTFWQHFQKLNEAARLYARNPIVIEALAELMLEQGGDEPRVERTRILDVATKTEELRRRFERHYNDGDRNIIVNEKWERYQDRLAKVKEGLGRPYEARDRSSFEASGSDDDEEEDEFRSFRVKKEDEFVPFEKQANAGAGIDPKFAGIVHHPSQSAHLPHPGNFANHPSGNVSQFNHGHHPHHHYNCRRGYGPAAQVITHPYRTPGSNPWVGRGHVMTKLEESLVAEVAALDAPKPESPEPTAEGEVTSETQGQPSQPTTVVASQEDEEKSPEDAACEVCPSGCASNTP